MQSVVGIVGGGQLARMMAEAANPLDTAVRIFCASDEEPTRTIPDRVIGSLEDPVLIERFAKGLAAATFEFENVPASTLAALAELVPVSPSARALAIGQDRTQEKALFAKLGIRTTRNVTVHSLEEAQAATRSWSFPFVAKTTRLGYDGKGQRIVRDAPGLSGAFEELAPKPVLLEEFIRFDFEVSQICVRDRKGAIEYYPLTQNVHHEGILRTSTAPSPDGSALVKHAQEIARRIAEELDYVGVLCIEFFVRNGELYANEIAPRVHNSGHWTIEGAVTSQFENHIRAVQGLPLGSTEAKGNSRMENIIGEIPSPDELAKGGGHVHLYGKTPRPGRKLGHITWVKA